MVGVPSVHGIEAIAFVAAALEIAVVLVRIVVLAGVVVLTLDLTCWEASTVATACGVAKVSSFEDIFNPIYNTFERCIKATYHFLLFENGEASIPVCND
jgi:hypothetical protein